MEFTTDWFSPNPPIWEKIVLPRLPIHRPRRVLELGCHEGRATAWLLENAVLDGEMVCIDQWHNADVEKRFDANVGDRVTKIKSKTQSALLTMVMEKQQFDCIYIDADHRAAAILEDALLAWQLTPPGGIIIFDDYEWSIPTRYSINTIAPHVGVDAFLSVYGLELRVLHKAYQVIVERFPPPYVVK
jgi:predicted O-methyltransferase YrrM